MSHRPLVLVSALTLGDYLLWNWSLGANHDILALVSGLTLPALALAFLWLLLLSFGRLLARSGRRSRPPVGAEERRGVREAPRARGAGPALRTYPSAASTTAAGADDADPADARPGKLAA